MESSDLETLRAAAAWLGAGAQVALVTVAKTWGSSPRPRGSLMAVRADGGFVGSVSGGCVEEDLVARVRAGELPSARPRVITYGVTSERTQRFGLPCGGRLELVVERLATATAVNAVVRCIEARTPIARRLCLATGEASLHPARRDTDFAYDERDLIKVFGPAWRLLVIGAGQLSRYVAQMALALDYEVVVCDPRSEYAAAWEVAAVRLDRRMPDDAVRSLAVDARCAVLALTHDPKLDDLALMEALGSQAFYVGALGSAANNAKRRARLIELGVSETAVGRLHGPVGLPIGSRTAPEIAIAVLAGMTATRHGVALVPVTDRSAAVTQADAGVCDASRASC